MKSLHLIFFIFIHVLIVQAQEGVIHFLNGSFEGEASGSSSTMPQGWMGCRMGTTPDILPGSWGVLSPPSHGQNYIGLITREDGSFESISQRLQRPLQASTCYRFTLDLAHSATYSGYNLPVRLRIWGALQNCKYEQLLWESSLINGQNWRKQEIQFFAKKGYRFLSIEAYFAPGVFMKYRGNILIDNITPLIPCDGA